MKNVSVVLITIVLLLTCTAVALAASASFAISVTMPAIIGVNFFPTEMTNTPTTNVASSISFMTTSEKVERDGETVELQTVAVK